MNRLVWKLCPITWKPWSGGAACFWCVSRISAQAQGTSVEVEYAPISDSGVAEVTVIPDSTSLADTVLVTIIGERKSHRDSLEVWVAVIEGFTVDEESAIEYRDRFVPWLGANHPELGIDSTTSWIGISGRPNILVVSHYLFFSDEWEMGLTWHVMIPPYDWSSIYLRHRGTEFSPSLAFEIPSVDAGDDPISVAPPDSVDR
jgi:hypothetical protein